MIILVILILPGIVLQLPDHKIWYCILQCLSNGVNFNKIQSGEPSNVEVLELFFSNYPRIVHMHLFPCLTSLCLVGQPIQKINGLSSLKLLKELWMCECQIKVVMHVGG